MLETAKQLFTQETRKASSEIDLAYAALLIAEHLTRPIDRTAYLERLNRMADTIQPAVQNAQTDYQVIEALNDYLFGQIRFFGDTEHYYDPNNSFLNRVLDRRRGIPITLSVVYLEVGQRLHLPTWGVGMPGHFIVAYGAESAPIFIDVFNRGEILSEDDCLRICNVPRSQRVTFRKQFLKPTSKKAILYRMLLNLKHIYLNQQNWETALKTVNLLMIIRPNQLTERRDRGLIYYRLNRLQDALADLQRYLFLSPDPQDKQVIEERITAAEEILLRLN